MSALLQHDPVGPFLDDIPEVDGVSLLLTDMGYGTVFIDLLEVHPSKRAMGLGRKMMNDLIELADAWGVTLMLKAASMCEMMEQDALEAFYGRRGFRVLRRCPTHGYPTMQRDPV